MLLNSPYCSFAMTTGQLPHISWLYILFDDYNVTDYKTSYLCCIAVSLVETIFNDGKLLTCGLFDVSSLEQPIALKWQMYWDI